MATTRSRRARVVDRVLDRRATVRRAVLRVDDMRRNVMPVVCVKSGERTDHAVRTTAVEGAHVEGWVIAIGLAATVGLTKLRRGRVRDTSLPVSERTWRTWQSRLRLAIAVTSAGAALLVIGLIRGIPALVVVGAVLIALGWLNRVRAWHNAWVGVAYRSKQDEIVISRVHSAFDAEAAEIYRRSVLRPR